jgi:hypothetical protein
MIMASESNRDSSQRVAAFSEKLNEKDVSGEGEAAVEMEAIDSGME